MKNKQIVSDYVEKETGISMDRMVAAGRRKSDVEARSLFIFIAIESGTTYSELGRILNRDHTTIIHSYNNTKFSEEMRTKYDGYIAYKTKLDPKSATIRIRFTGRYGFLYERFGGKCGVCGFSEIVEVHHILPRKMGGEDNPENLMLLCPNHHALADRGMLHIDEISVNKQRV